jgi:hypothetical protein
MSEETLKDFVRAALNLGDAARYVIDGETFGHAELVAALARELGARVDQFLNAWIERGYPYNQ